MTDYRITTEDVAQMRREGTMRDFLRMVRRPSAGQDRATGRQTSQAMPTDHTPGAWPTGTSSGAPGSRECPCPACTRLAEGRPPLEQLLGIIDTDQAG